MITDSAKKNDINQQWASIRLLCRDSHRQAAVGGAGGIVEVNETRPESFYNLPFVLAFAVLDEVLKILIDEGKVQCQRKNPYLGEKMDASKGVLPWQNYALVERGKAARNDLAHEAKLLSKSQCIAFIDGIEADLKAWGVL